MLGVTNRDDRSRILEAAEERSLTHDPDLCQQARAILTTPRRRLEAELSWFPGTAPKAATQALTATVSQLAQLPLAGLAKANAFEFSASEWTPKSAGEVKEFLGGLSEAVSEIDAEQLLREVNEDRDIAGFPQVTSVDLIEEVLRDRRQAWRRSAMDLLNRSQTDIMIEGIYTLVEELVDEDRFPEFMHELIADYALRAQPFMSRELAGAEKLVAKARDVAGRRSEALLPIFNAMEELLETWEQLTRPIQLSATVLGKRDAESENLAFMFRSLSVDLNNDHSLISEARRVADMVGEHFSALPRIVAQVEEDTAALDELAASAEEKEANFAYAAEVGTFRKSRLAIDKNGLEWKGKRTALSEIKGVRWGGVRNTVNGIDAGVEYLIAWHDGGPTTSVKLRNSTIYEEFLSRLMQTVGYRLIADMASTLRFGGELRFGNMIARDSTVVLPCRKFIGTGSAEFDWSDVSINSHDGSFFVEGPEGSKASISLSYRAEDNVRLFEILVRQAFKNGHARLSEGFE